MKKDLQSSEDYLPAHEIKDYQSLVGGENWLACITRPDIFYALSRLSKYMSKPAEVHKEAAKQLLCYLAATKNDGLIFGTKSQDIKLYGYINSSFASDADNRANSSL